MKLWAQIHKILQSESKEFHFYNGGITGAIMCKEEVAQSNSNEDCVIKSVELIGYCKCFHAGQKLQMFGLNIFRYLKAICSHKYINVMQEYNLKLKIRAQIYLS